MVEKILKKSTLHSSFEEKFQLHSWIKIIFFYYFFDLMCFSFTFSLLLSLTFPFLHAFYLGPSFLSVY